MFFLVFVFKGNFSCMQFCMYCIWCVSLF